MHAERTPVDDEHRDAATYRQAAAMVLAEALAASRGGPRHSAARPNGLPSESRQIAQRSPG